MKNNAKTSSGNSVLLVFTIFLLALPFIVWWKAQALTDWWQLRNYTPPAAISSLASQDKLTDYATRIFYVNHPELQQDAMIFRESCKESEKTIVLGCYHSNQAGIFLFDVTDQRLNGVEQVTAAHEMLHAAYDRLTAKDRRQVNSWLEDYYRQVKDQRIIDTINNYRQTEPNDVVNEMHSIFGTEIVNLTPELEKYYSQYFTDRSTVVGFASNYKGEFTNREEAIKADDVRLAALKAQIDEREQELKQQLNEINAERNRLDSLRNSNIQQYNSNVASYNAQIDSYNQGVGSLKSAIAAYNSLVAERNAIAEELANLSKSIDTRLVSQAAQ